MIANFGLGGPDVNLRKHANKRPYAPIEEHIVRALVLACGCKAHYNRVINFFCGVFDRWPAEIRVCYIDKGIRVPSKKMPALTENIVQRYVWGPVVRYRGKTVIDKDYTREGLPVTYIEGTKFIKRWRETSLDGKPSIEVLATVLGRRTTDIIEACEPARLVNDRTAYDPTKDQAALGEVVRKLRGMDLADTNLHSEVLATYRNFMNLITGRTV